MAHPWIFEWWGSIQLVHMRSLSIILNGRSRNSWAPLPVCPCISYGHLCGHFSIATRGSNTSNVMWGSRSQGPHRRTSRFSTTGVNHWLLYDHREQGTQHWSLMSLFHLTHYRPCEASCSRTWLTAVLTHTSSRPTHWMACSQSDDLLYLTLWCYHTWYREYHDIVLWYPKMEDVF